MVLMSMRCGIWTHNLLYERLMHRPLHQCKHAYEHVSFWFVKLNNQSNFMIVILNPVFILYLFLLWLKYIYKALCTRGRRPKSALRCDWLKKGLAVTLATSWPMRRSSDLPRTRRHSGPGRDRVAKPPESSRSLLNLNLISWLSVSWSWGISVALPGNTCPSTEEKLHVLRLRSVFSLDIRITSSSTCIQQPFRLSVASTPVQML